jgi:hypothetical protein
VDELSTTVGIVALAALGVALVGLLVAMLGWRRLSRVRADQRVVIGDGERDLAAHAADLERQFASLHDYVVDVATRLEGRLDVAEDRLDGVIAHRAILRYDAYNEMSGRQSTTIALLDAHRSGIVLSSIHHRDQARLYAKQVVEGSSAVPLSPEEEAALDAALGGVVPDATPSS